MNLGFCFVDVRDCAAAHLAALEKPDAAGRYVCCDESIMIKDIIDYLRTKFPAAKVPTRDWTGSWMTSILKFFTGMSGSYQNQFIHYALGGVMRVDNSKIKNELGIVFRDPRDGWVEVVNQMIQAGSIASLVLPNET
jgi:dihydroflavonol-4-reductase